MSTTGEAITSLSAPASGQRRCLLRVLPPLCNSWIILTIHEDTRSLDSSSCSYIYIYLYIALHVTPNVDCYRVVAVPTSTLPEL